MNSQAEQAGFTMQAYRSKYLFPFKYKEDSIQDIKTDQIEVLNESQTEDLLPFVHNLTGNTENSPLNRPPLVSVRSKAGKKTADFIIYTDKNNKQIAAMISAVKIYFFKEGIAVLSIELQSPGGSGSGEMTGDITSSTSFATSIEDFLVFQNSFSSIRNQSHAFYIQTCNKKKGPGLIDLSLDECPGLTAYADSYAFIESFISDFALDNETVFDQGYYYSHTNKKRLNHFNHSNLLAFHSVLVADSISDSPLFMNCIESLVYNRKAVNSKSSKSETPEGITTMRHASEIHLYGSKKILLHIGFNDGTPFFNNNGSNFFSHYDNPYFLEYMIVLYQQLRLQDLLVRSSIELNHANKNSRGNTDKLIAAAKARIKKLDNQVKEDDRKSSGQKSAASISGMNAELKALNEQLSKLQSERKAQKMNNKNRKNAESLKTDLLNFLVGNNYTQISNHPIRSAVYTSYRSIFQINDLLDEIQVVVEGIDEYLQAYKEQRSAWFNAGISTIGGVIALIQLLQYIGIDIPAFIAG